MIEPDSATLDSTLLANIPVSNYKRQPPPFVVRCFFGFVLYGVLGPISRICDTFGRKDLVLRLMTASRIRGQTNANPFRNYVPTKHDVFVATFAKSGTNWMMQIAHQLAFHAKGEFDHIHCVVPWPDTQLMGPMRKYAIPIVDPWVWKASPEQKRVIKTHFDWDFIPYS